MKDAKMLSLIPCSLGSFTASLHVKKVLKKRKCYNNDQNETEMKYVC